LAGTERIDILINNAGYQPRTPLGDPSPEIDRAFRRVIEVNVLGTYYVTRRTLPRMRRGGRIIVTSSIWGKTGAAEYSGYCASKHAVLGFMRSLALELGARGIAVNAVCPGWVETEGAMWTVREIAEEVGREPGALIDDYLRPQPIPGMMAPRDLAAAYLFLASNGAANITGQAINVDRGHFIG
jgi:NAD(P)-dependent dehydrogenase (short-subunit alcohol dehydrogenase family)